MGWRDNSLLIFAELMDIDIFNSAIRPNQRLWELGDVFEVFLRPVNIESYAEFQIAPDNQRLQLRFPNDRVVERLRNTNRFEDAMVADQMFHSMTWTEAHLCRWYVHVEIQASAVYGHDECMENAQWRFSFGRHDYTRGSDEPVVSSTSPHARPDFHRQSEWGTVTFTN